MMPTMFADETVRMLVAVDALNGTNLRPLASILPTLCKGTTPEPVGYFGDVVTIHNINCACADNGGRGWLYPPMPDWYPHEIQGEILRGDFTGEAHWEEHCQTTWRAMGIIEGATP